MSRQTCSRRQEAAAFVRTLKVADSYIDHDHDRCYCTECYRATYPDTIDNEGPTAYVVPRGWVRVGLADPRLQDPDMDVFNKWSASFHAVASRGAKLCFYNSYLP